MAVNIQHKLSHLSITPPPDAWPAIAARLNTEYDAEETALSQKIYDIEVMPPAAGWANIAAGLETDEPVKKEISTPVISFRRVMAAAAILTAISVTAWYFFNNTGTRSSVLPQAATVTDNTKTDQPQPPAPIAATGTEQADNEPAQKSQRTITRYNQRTASQAIADNAVDYTPIATTYAGVNEAQAVRFTASSSPTIAAPLIRDANGQIILDKNLITSPDNCYITITGPNGEQTRISSKFLHIISSLNADTEPQDYFGFMRHENSLWKMRFQEWRNKLLNQPSLIPTATNFLDILELKDILQEENNEQ